MEIHKHSITYTKDYRLKASYLEVFSFYLNAIVRYKQFIWVNFLKYFKASYEQSLLSMTWKIIIPLVPVSVYVVLQELGLLRSNSSMPSVLYVVVGMTFWQLFSSSLTMTMGAPTKEKAILKKINIPFVLFYISGMGEVIFDYFIRVALIWVLMLAFKIEFSLSWIILPFFFLPLALFGFTLGILCSFFSIFFNDVRNIVDIVLRYGLFACGVLFPIPEWGGISKILVSNPLYILIENLRQLLVFNRFENLQGFILSVVALIIFTLVVLKKLYSLEPRMREYL